MALQTSSNGFSALQPMHNGSYGATARYRYVPMDSFAPSPHLSSTELEQLSATTLRQHALMGRIPYVEGMEQVSETSCEAAYVPVGFPTPRVCAAMFFDQLQDELDDAPLPLNSENSYQSAYLIASTHALIHELSDLYQHEHIHDTTNSDCVFVSSTATTPRTPSTPSPVINTRTPVYEPMWSSRRATKEIWRPW